MDSNSNNSDNMCWPKMEYDSDVDRDPKKCERPHWNSENTMKLIEIMERDCKELWDTNHPLNKVRSARQMKLEYLANLFSTSSEEISRKIHNLRTQFNNELRKIKRKQSGVSDVSGWEYFDSLMFLQRAPLVDPLDTMEAVNLELAEFQANEEIEFAAARANLSVASSSSPKTRKPALRVSANIPSSHCEARVAPLPPNNPMWRKEVEPKIHSDLTPDECQIFGDFVASELRMLRSTENRKRLKRIIQKAILQIGEEEDVNIIRS